MRLNCLATAFARVKAEAIMLVAFLALSVSAVLGQEKASGPGQGEE
jgi:hypothetical protein